VGRSQLGDDSFLKAMVRERRLIYEFEVRQSYGAPS